MCIIPKSSLSVFTKSLAVNCSDRGVKFTISVKYLFWLRSQQSQSTCYFIYLHREWWPVEQHLKFYSIDREDFVNKSTHVIVSLNMHFVETCLLTTCSLACISHFQHYTSFHLVDLVWNQNNKQT